MEKLLDERVEENQAYLSSHPEVKAILTSFLQEVFKQKPENVEDFAREYFQNKKELHPPLVIVGPSGVGKGTLIHRLMKEFSDVLGFSVSHTTRDPRPGEEHGTHYHFTTHEEFRDRISKGHFIEHAEVHGNIYGTSIDAVTNVQQAGKICVLDIDIQGLESVKQTSFSPKTLYIAPPNHEELEKRLRGRGTESEESIQKRLSNAHKEMNHLEKPGSVHHKIVNDDLDTAYEELKRVLLSWYPHLNKN